LLSCAQIATKQKDLKKKLRVSFVQEPGLDMGGLTKEWFLLLIRDIFQVSAQLTGLQMICVSITLNHLVNDHLIELKLLLCLRHIIE
jgi:hypothetical protein